MDPSELRPATAPPLKGVKASRTSDSRILAIDPTSKGFGFVVFEGPRRLVDWGIVDVSRADNERALSRLQILLEWYDPVTVVMEDADDPASRRRPRVRTLLSSVRVLAERRGLQASVLPWARVREAFSDSRARTKHHIAMILAARFPELGLRLPPPRKPWMSEDPRLRIFTAAALGVAYQQYKSNRRRSS